MFRSKASSWRTRFGATSYVVAITAIGSLIALALPLLISAKTNDWGQLSNIGQAYGTVAAILSAFALIGISASLILQSSQIKISRTALNRERHFELLKMTLDDPSLVVTPTEFKGQELRLMISSNLWVTHWNMRWELGAMPDDSLYSLFEGLFKHPVAYRWWAVDGANWGSSQTRTEQRFLQIAHRAHAASAPPGLELEPQEKSSPLVSDLEE